MTSGADLLKLDVINGSIVEDPGLLPPPPLEVPAAGVVGLHPVWGGFPGVGSSSPGVVRVVPVLTVSRSTESGVPATWLPLPVGKNQLPVKMASISWQKERSQIHNCNISWLSQNPEPHQVWAPRLAHLPTTAIFQHNHLHSPTLPPSVIYPQSKTMKGTNLQTPNFFCHFFLNHMAFAEGKNQLSCLFLSWTILHSPLSLAFVCACSCFSLCNSLSSLSLWLCKGLLQHRIIYKQKRLLCLPFWLSPLGHWLSIPTLHTHKKKKSHH